MTDINEAYTNNEYNPTYEMPSHIEEDLEKLLEDRNSMFSNSDVFFKPSHIVSENDLDILKREFDPTLLIQESNKYKDTMFSKLNQLTILNCDLEHSSAQIDSLVDTKVSLHSLFEKQFIDNVLSSIDPLIADTKKKYDSISSNINKLEKEIFVLFKFSPYYTNNDPKKTCPICLHKEIAVAMVPCGHTLCQPCANSLPSRSCFICRSDVKHILKLYI